MNEELNDTMESINDDDYSDFDVRIHYELCKNREERKKLHKLVDNDLFSRRLKPEYFPKNLYND